MPRILLVEDNELNRDSLSRLLRRHGFEVIFAEDGEIGVRKAIEEKPDLVLMDIGLPVLDGYGATEQIRATPGMDKLPIIALTAHALQKDQARAMEAGCNEFETKPIEFPRLLGKIERLINGIPS